ncbi:unnamed protein product [Closterium sp. Yama58-4]|nr:unnamed protein product [Closterium sp. Yama58-4]
MQASPRVAHSRPRGVQASAHGSDAAGRLLAAGARNSRQGGASTQGASRFGGSAWGGTARGGSPWDGHARGGTSGSPGRDTRCQLFSSQTALRIPPLTIVTEAAAMDEREVAALLAASGQNGQLFPALLPPQSPPDGRPVPRNVNVARVPVDQRRVARASAAKMRRALDKSTVTVGVYVKKEELSEDYYTEEGEEVVEREGGSILCFDALLLLPSSASLSPVSILSSSIPTILTPRELLSRGIGDISAVVWPNQRLFVWQSGFRFDRLQTTTMLFKGLPPAHADSNTSGSSSSSGNDSSNHSNGAEAGVAAGQREGAAAHEQGREGREAEDAETELKGAHEESREVQAGSWSMHMPPPLQVPYPLKAPVPALVNRHVAAAGAAAAARPVAGQQAGGEAGGQRGGGVKFPWGR